MEGTAQYAWNMWRITEAATEKRISMVIQGRIRSHSNENSHSLKVPRASASV